MSLNSLDFIFLFLPLAIILHCLLVKKGLFHLAIVGVIGASAVFAGWRNLVDPTLILFSILINYLVGLAVCSKSSAQKARRKLILIFGLTANLSLLAFFKYSKFFLDNINAVMHTANPLVTIYLPLGISFLTLQQIAYLIDAYRGHIKEINFLEYCVFCSFFPKLSSGPIVRYGELVPQIVRSMRSLSLGVLAEGTTLFAIGLFKKVVLADSMAHYADPTFRTASFGRDLGMVEAWGGVLAYTFQLYFDFSGYTDMAIGIARMFGITLPENFNSPYKATNIIEFWMRWHMTLSRFLRDYLYIPLGGNRKGVLRHHLNLMVTMLLCGLWHGASWTFVIWGALHGIYLSINHGWRRLGVSCSHAIGWILTFIALSMAWAWFRADSVPAAGRITASLIGLNGLWVDGFRGALHSLSKPAPEYNYLAQFFVELKVAVSFGRWTIYPVNILLSEPFIHTYWLLASGVIVLSLPNTREWLDLANQHPTATLTIRKAIFIGVLLFFVLLASISSHPSAFIYEKF